MDCFHAEYTQKIILAFLLFWGMSALTQVINRSLIFLLQMEAFCKFIVNFFPKVRSIRKITPDIKRLSDFWSPLLSKVRLSGPAAFFCPFRNTEPPMKKARAQQPPQLHNTSLEQGPHQDPRGSRTCRTWVTQNQPERRWSKVVRLQNVHLLAGAGRQKGSRSKSRLTFALPRVREGCHTSARTQGHCRAPVIPPSGGFLSCLGAASRWICFAVTFQSCGCILFVKTTEASGQQRSARCPGSPIHSHSPQVLFL